MHSKFEFLLENSHNFLYHILKLKTFEYILNKLKTVNRYESCHSADRDHGIFDIAIFIVPIRKSKNNVKNRKSRRLGRQIKGSNFGNTYTTGHYSVLN